MNPPIYPLLLLLIGSNFAAKINLDSLNNYSEFLNFGNEKLHKLDKHHLENSIFKSKVEVLGEIFKKHVEFLKNSALDIIFLVDASSSVGAYNFKSELKFIKKLLSDITVDYNHTRVAVVTFSSPSNIRKNIDEISKPSTENNKCLLLNNQLMQIDYKGGETFTLGAFQTAQGIFESSQRNNTKRVLFLITDGYSNGGDPVPLSNELKKNDITIFTIGIQNGNYKELYDLSSTPGQFYSYLLDSFEEFESLARRALHVDLKSGDYVPLGFNKPCDGLCEEGNCCDENAVCACGTTTGHYKCVCQPGYYGSGLKNNCLPCIPGTYSDGPDLCLPCPDVHHTTTPPALGIESCTCKIGYQSDNNGGCKDLECPQISIPEHGYVVKKRECRNVLNSACGIRCEVGYTLVGSSIRLCQENATWSGTQTTCEVKTCERLPVPKYGSIKCLQSDLGVEYDDNEKKLPVDTVCNFGCEKGKMLIGSTQRTCLPLARWDGLRTTCKPLKCNRLPQLKFGTTEPASCTTGKQEYGKTCKITCNEGFKIEGPSEKTCTGDYGNWEPKFEETTCKDVTPPQLTCPNNITASTMPSKKFGHVKWTKPTATDNSGLDVSVWSKPNIKIIEEFKFQIGVTPVTYFAQDSFNNRKKCTFHIHIKDTELPVIENCIDPPPFLTEDPNGANITWDEPSIYDNSQNVVVNKSHEFGFFKTGTTAVTYRASDKSGNENICVLNITIEVARCDPLPLPVNADSECTEEQNKIECLITCQEGYAIPIPETIEDNATNFICDHSESIWYNKDGLVYPECQITKVPKEVITEGEINLIVPDNEACKDNQELNKLEADLKSKISNQLCIENCTVDLKSECETEKAEESTNKILRKREAFVELPHKNKKRKRLNVKFQVRGKYLNETVSKNNLQLNNVTVPLRKLKFVCPVGFVPRKNRCVQCPKGTFYNSTSNHCQSCGFGFYNDKLAQTECISCPLYHSTRKYHSKKAEDCKEQCPPGTHARKKRMKVSKHEPKHSVERATLKPFCKPCPIGTYQSDYGQLKCILCPTGFTTTTVKSTNETQCSPTSEHICNTLLNACNYRGKCVANNDYEFSCECHDNYIGPYCEKHVDQCRSQPCLNNAICLSQGETDYKCVCQEGFSGKFCERIEEKCSRQCFNGGTCLESDDEDSEAICLCPKGFIGDNCETPATYCTGSICENNSTCLEDIGTFRCVCQKGFFGKRCHILPCDYKPCMGFSDCLNVFEDNATRESYRCVCPVGYTGDLCDKKIDYCKSSPCLNGATCSSLEMNYSCKCSSLFRGENCQFRRNTKYLLNFSNYDVNNYVRLKGFLGNITQITVCLWMQTIDNFNYGTVLSYATRFRDNAFTITDYTGLVLYVNNEYVVTDVLLNDGYWHHVCVSWKSEQGTYKILVDGNIIKSDVGLSPDTTIQGGGNIIIGQEQDIIGGRFSQSESFVGNMAYIDVWSTFLTDDEILYHFNDCADTFFGDLYPWPEIQEHVFGNIQVLNSSFCMDCDFPKPLYNGFIDVKDNTAYYSCYEGFELSDRTYEKGRKCTKVSKWEGANYDPYCQRIYCGYPGYVKNAYSIGNKYYFQDEVKFRCLEGYTMIGENVITCNSEGLWVPDIPQCIGAQCSAFAKPKYSYLNIFSEQTYEEFVENKTKFDPGTQIEIVCRENDNNATILLCLDSGTWDSSPPNCLPKPKQKESKNTLDCATNLIPDPPKNGYVYVDSREAVENGSQNFVEYRCRPGYKLLGINISTCIIDGYWTELNASCIAITCPDAPTFKYMVLSPKTPKNNVYQFGNMLRYECEEGYELLGNNNVIRCTVNGKWSRMIARCTKKSCKKPIVSPDTLIEGKSYLFEDKVTITCKNFKKYELFCNKDGIWEGDRDYSC